ncbi:MAG: PorP/SprF family type IX secretion system membrane protein [Taibaiella sp.]|nr:PorP/SprF family type IX secretion system membrane protein [Taibaiella sp.]
MSTKTIIGRLTLAAALSLSAPAVFAQDIHFSQFDMQPLVVNPAFTGMFDGQARAGGIYRNQWGSVTVPYVTMGAYADMPLYVDQGGGYLAAGLQVFNDKAGDGNLQNFTGALSLAYHKTLGSSTDLAVGLQGAYAQKSIDLSRLYFGDESVNGTFVPGTSNEYQLGIGNSVSYYVVNAGVSLAGGSERLSYVIGIGANNINQPNDALLKKQTSTVGLDMRYTAQAGLSARASDRFYLRPAVIYQNQASASEIIAGNEFLYYTGQYVGYTNFSTALFLGAWYRTSDAAILNAGIELKGIRIGIAYDYNISSLNSASNGRGGFEIALRYIAPYPQKFAGKRVIPCDRF